MRLTSTIERGMEKVEDARGLDRVAQPLAGLVRRVSSLSTSVTNLLHGVPLGHPAHPAIVLAPIGTFVSATILDFVPGTGPAVPVLTLAGIGTAVPAAAAGLVDWADLHPQQQRVGLVHAAANVLTIGMQLASWKARRQGRHARGAALSLAALAVGNVGAYLGGHLAYRLGAMVNHAEEAPHILPEQWTLLGRLDELPDGKPTRRTLDGVPVFVLRRDRQVDVLYDLCSHLSGPLSEGELSGAGDEVCITCPWHGSTFRLRDGDVRRGPTTYPQPVLQVRVDPEGSVHARLGEDD